MNKIFVLIVDDDEADKIRGIVTKSILKSYCEVEVCEWVETVLPSFIKQKPKVAIDLIKYRSQNKLQLDFAFIDVQYEDEFGDDTTIGASKVMSALQRYYPNCRIIVLSKNEGTFLDRYAEFNGQRYPTIKKTALQEYHDTIIERELESWIRLKCQQISAINNKGKEIIQLLNQKKIKWNSIINANGEQWSLEGLFFLYKKEYKNDGKRIFEKIVSFFIEFPIIKAERGGDKWNGNEEGKGSTQIKLPLKDFYIEFYFNHFYRLKEIEEDAKKFLDLFYLIFIQKETKKENEIYQFINKKRANGLVYSAVLHDFKAEPKLLITAINNFQDKLFIRLTFWGCYIFMASSVEDFLNLFSWSRATDNNNTLSKGKKKKDFEVGNTKLLNTHFWIKDLNDVFDVKKRNQNYLFETLCSGDERGFLKKWWFDLLSENKSLSNNTRLMENYEYIRID